jgi:hypothetical protein
VRGDIDFSGKQMVGKRSKMDWSGPAHVKNRMMGPTHADMESFKVLGSLLLAICCEML